MIDRTPVCFVILMSFFTFQIQHHLPGTHHTDTVTHSADIMFLHPDVGVHDIQRVALHGSGAGHGAGILHLRVEEGQRGRPQRALPLIHTTCC